MTEPVILINGYQLTEAQAMTVRVAIQGFAALLATDGLGDDEEDVYITNQYLARLVEIRSLICLGSKA